MRYLKRLTNDESDDFHIINTINKQQKKKSSKKKLVLNAKRYAVDLKRFEFLEVTNGKADLIDWLENNQGWVCVNPTGKELLRKPKAQKLKYTKEGEEDFYLYKYPFYNKLYYTVTEANKQVLHNYKIYVFNRDRVYEKMIPLKDFIFSLYDSFSEDNNV